MTIWTVLLRIGKHRRRYFETQVYANTRQEAIEVAMRCGDLRKATVVSAQPEEPR